MTPTKALDAAKVTNDTPANHHSAVTKLLLTASIFAPTYHANEGRAILSDVFLSRLNHLFIIAYIYY